jgi:LPS-assembly lipoprotein
MRAAAALALSSSLLLAGCGFSPMYAETAAGSPLRRIAVSVQDDRLGYRLVDHRMELYGTAIKPAN